MESDKVTSNESVAANVSHVSNIYEVYLSDLEEKALLSLGGVDEQLAVAVRNKIRKTEKAGQNIFAVIERDDGTGWDDGSYGREGGIHSWQIPSDLRSLLKPTPACHKFIKKCFREYLSCLGFNLLAEAQKQGKRILPEKIDFDISDDDWRRFRSLPGKTDDNLVLAIKHLAKSKAEGKAPADGGELHPKTRHPYRCVGAETQISWSVPADILPLLPPESDANGRASFIRRAIRLYIKENGFWR